MDEARPSYYAIIPADVRYDDDIPPNAKLLYGEISALIGAEGYCYASNAYFSQIYKMSAETISRLISKLEKAGYIHRQVVKDNTGQIVSRRLYLTVSMPRIQAPDGADPAPDSVQGGIDEKINTPCEKNQEGIDEKVKGTNKSNTNNTPHSPPEGGAGASKKKSRGQKYKAQAEVLPERFEKFWEFYRTNVPPDRNAGNRQAALRAWDKLQPTSELVTVMAKALAAQVKTEAWKSGIGVPHASTWLNNHGWEDDWGSAAGSNTGLDENQNSEEAVEWVH